MPTLQIQLPNGKWFDYARNLTMQQAEELKAEMDGEFLRVQKVRVVE